LLKIRFIILKINEPYSIGGSTKGLPTWGRPIFLRPPSESLLAATNDAAAVKRLEHDEKVAPRFPN
jgi:hypothetical protein